MNALLMALAILALPGAAPDAAGPQRQTDPLAKPAPAWQPVVPAQVRAQVLEVLKSRKTDAAAMANAPQPGAGYFKVPKVIER